MYNLNLFGLIEVTQAFATQVIAAKGQVINIGSLNGVIPTPLQGVYNSSKAAVHSLSDTLRVEMAPFGVKVICVSRDRAITLKVSSAMLLTPSGTLLQVITGGIKTPFFKNCPDYSFPDDSPYKAAREILEPILATRTTSVFRSKPIYRPIQLVKLDGDSILPGTPEEYATSVVQNSLGWWPSVRLWTGSETSIGWFISTFLWHTILVRALYISWLKPGL